MWNRRATWLAAILCLGVVACVEPGPDAGPDAADTGIREPETSADGFVLEHYGIGADWYEYSRRNHTVSPRDEVYRIRRGDLDALLEVVGYYDDRGESGYFTLRSRRRRDGGWGPTEELVLDRNVKQTDICLTLDPLETADCDVSRVDLVLRTDRRTIPSAGFAISNPAIYAPSHRVDTRPSPRLERVPVEAIGSLPEEFDGTRLSDARHSPSRSAIRAPRHVHLQATAEMMLAQWAVAGIDQSESELEVTLRSRCVELATGPSKQESLSEGSLGTVEVTPRSVDSYEVVLVDVCDREVVERADAPHRARWPSTDSFDLFVEQVEGELAIRAAPGHLVWDWTADEGDGSTDFEEVEPPEGLWDQ